MDTRNVYRNVYMWPESVNRTTWKQAENDKYGVMLYVHVGRVIK